MSQKLCNRLAEETQLLAEEKWLLEALTKIRNQRNCLQIERLHLESMKANIKQSPKPSHTITDSEKQTVATVVTSQPDPVSASSRNGIEFEVSLLGEDSCNDEELDLGVTPSVFNRNLEAEFSMEEYDDEDDCDNIVIDINMLMNGTVPK